MNNSFAFLSFIFGAIVGSFLNVVILRLPIDNESIVFPASRCPICKKSIQWFDNIPILSFLFLLGKCRHCQTSISMQYPLVELSMALLSVAIYTKFGLSFELFCYFAFAAALLIIIFIDIQHQIIPDVISLPGILIGFTCSFFNRQVSWQDSALGILLGGGILYGVALIYYLVTKREGMGGGDIKLLAMLGAFLGWQSLLFIIFASSLSGSLFGLISMLISSKGSKTKIAYGPFLSGAALCYLLFQEQIFSLWQTFLTL